MFSDLEDLQRFQTHLDKNSLAIDKIMNSCWSLVNNKLRHVAPIIVKEESSLERENVPSGVEAVVDSEEHHLRTFTSPPSMKRRYLFMRHSRGGTNPCSLFINSKSDKLFLLPVRFVFLTTLKLVGVPASSEPI